MQDMALRDWKDIVRRLRLGSSVKTVALALLSYANKDGTRVFPGIARLAYETELHHLTVKRALKRLRDLGLIVKVGKKGEADEYNLIIHEDLLERVELPSPAQAEIEIEKIRAQVRRRPKMEIQVPEAPVLIDEHDVVQVPSAPVETDVTDGCTGAQGTPEETRTGALGTPVQVPEAPATYQDHSYKSTSQTRGDQIGDVTVDREPGLPEDSIPPMDADVAAAAARLGDPLCRRHRLPKATCNLCRRGLPGKTGAWPIIKKRDQDDQEDPPTPIPNLRPHPANQIRHPQL